MRDRLRETGIDTEKVNEKERRRARERRREAQRVRETVRKRQRQRESEEKNRESLRDRLRETEKERKQRSARGTVEKEKKKHALTTNKGNSNIRVAGKSFVTDAHKEGQSG